MEKKKYSDWSIAIHGGSISGDMDEMTQRSYKDHLENALKRGIGFLESGGSSLDAVEYAVRYMENTGVFNAGKGSVYDENGKVFMDASIMDGRDFKCAAVAGVYTIKNPISLTRIMLHSREPVVFLSCEGAEKFADKYHEAERVSPDYFVNSIYSKGTVGCVAKDSKGNLASATSTGGISHKLAGRIGDSAVIGAGTFAKNETCAVSCTGIGEEFIRKCVAYDLSCRMEYGGKSLEEASQTIVHHYIKKEGGLIAIDKYGNISTPFNSKGMLRAMATPEVRKIAIFEEEESIKI